MVRSVRHPRDNCLAEPRRHQKQINTNTSMFRNEALLPLVRPKREMCAQNLQPPNTPLPPVRRVPVDILSMVFLECLPDRDNTQLVPSARTAPLLVSAICSDWREIAISTPHLWNSIFLSFDDMAHSNDVSLDCNLF